MENNKRPEETLRLIELFREREVLWNMNCFSYRRNDLKKKALEEIAEECNLTADAVKKRIKSLRSTYVQEKRRVESSKKSGCEAESVYKSSLYWYKEMSFLDSSIVVRKPIDNIQRSKSLESINIDETSESNESLLSCTQSTSKGKRKREDEETTKFDEALDKLVSLTKPANDAYSAFAEFLVIQLRTMPEDVAYRTMTDMQNLLFKRKFPSQPNSTNTFLNTRTSPPEAHDSDTLFTMSPESRASDILLTAMTEADILNQRQ